jgi:hypothetical protein
MSGESAFVSGSIEEVLLALASGVAEAQEKLNRLEPFDAYGRPRPQYHLPYLDFSLKVSIQSLTSTTSGNSAARTLGNPEGTQLLSAPAPRIALSLVPASSASKVNSEIVSTLSGRFVSVPPNDGMPQVALSMGLKKLAKSRFQISVLAVRSDGKPVVGGQVEFNIDAAMTESVNPTLAGKDMPPSASVLDQAVVTTDQTGSASCVADWDAVDNERLTKLFVKAQLGVLVSSVMIQRDT